MKQINKCTAPTPKAMAEQVPEKGALRDGKWWCWKHRYPEGPTSEKFYLREVFLYINI